MYLKKPAFVALKQIVYEKSYNLQSCPEKSYHPGAGGLKPPVFVIQTNLEHNLMDMLH